MLKEFGCSSDSLRRVIFRRAPVYLLVLCGWNAERALAAVVPTVTVMQVSSSTVQLQTSVTLTATVTASGAPVTPGQVLFCNASAARCTDLAILGSAQLTSNGTASIKLRLGPGSHGIYAKFMGTMTYAGSTSQSAVQTVEVTGHLPSTATISKYGNAAPYTLAASVTASGPAPPSGTVSFLDAMTNRQIASASFDSYTLKSGFAAPVVYSTGTWPNAVAVGDFNHDGVPDLAIANYFVGESVTILLGDPRHPGQFLPQQTYAAGVWPISIAVADFNGDGVLDLAVANENQVTGPGSVSILLGDATHPGQFLSQVTYATDLGTDSVVAGDFNRDGLPDLAAANYFSGDLSILLADPAHPGQFLPQQVIPLNAANPMSIATADFNGDGVLDLALGGNSDSDNISILLGDPAHPGNFLTQVQYSAGFTPYYVATGDLNGDGLPDLAVASFELTSGAEMLHILLSDPAHPGTFLPPVNYPAPNVNFNSIATGDFNGDGVVDIAASIPDAYPGIAIYSGDPMHPGLFLPAELFPINWDGFNIPGSLAVADFNGDSLADVALTQTADETTSIFLGAFTATATALNVNPGNTSYVYASYSGDNNYYGYQSCEISLTAGYWPVQPTISGVTVSNITQNSATISWTSDAATYGGVNYGTTTAFGSKTSWVNPVSVTHSFVLSNLKPGTTYDYQAWSVAYFTGCTHWTAFSPTATFTTAAAQ